MPARETKLAQQIDDAISDNRFQLQFLPNAISELSFESQESLMKYIIVQLDTWAVYYKHNMFFAMPKSVGEEADKLVRGYRNEGGAL